MCCTKLPLRKKLTSPSSGPSLLSSTNNALTSKPYIFLGSSNSTINFSFLFPSNSSLSSPPLIPNPLPSLWVILSESTLCANALTTPSPFSIFILLTPRLFVSPPFVLQCNESALSTPVISPTNLTLTHSSFVSSTSHISEHPSSLSLLLSYIPLSYFTNFNPFIYYTIAAYIGSTIVFARVIIIIISIITFFSILLLDYSISTKFFWGITYSVCASVFTDLN